MKDLKVMGKQLPRVKRSKRLEVIGMSLDKQWTIVRTMFSNVYAVRSADWNSDMENMRVRGVE